MTRQDYASAAGEAVAERVAARLVIQGAATEAELAQLDRLNGYELEVLVRLERGWGAGWMS